MRGSAALGSGGLEVLYAESGDILSDVRSIIDGSQQEAHRSVNRTLLARNWLLGRRIAAEELKGESRAEYGVEVIKGLSKQLKALYGAGFSRSMLYQCLQFYRLYPNIFQTLSGKSQLSWSHYVSLMKVSSEKARIWYEHEAVRQHWSVRQLERNLSTQYYERLLSTGIQDEKTPLLDEDAFSQSTADGRLEFIKNPLILEFLGIPKDVKVYETDLESAILSNLQQMLLEMGKGYAFVARQQHIRTELDDFFIDLVFYNYILKCFVLIDLKTSKITHQDIGQMDMYVRMYDELQRAEGDNPTIGIILCDRTDADVMHYSILSDKNQLFAARYLTYLPSEEDLRAEIEHQKALFSLASKEGEDE